FPNPFAETSNIQFNLPETGKVQIDVYNQVGQKVKSFEQGLLNEGQHQIELNRSDLSGSGMYYYHINLIGNAKTWSAKGTLVLVK
ncbi:MAG: T9SS type A sorting domain-containing protein, partial [Ignavibacteria bacterium]|nr:T9SS type A sorting domain-containing protein [Ignavibacteria bacterium]